MTSTIFNPSITESQLFCCVGVGEVVIVSIFLLYFSLKMFGTNYYFSYICPKQFDLLTY